MRSVFATFEFKFHGSAAEAGTPVCFVPYGPVGTWERHGARAVAGCWMKLFKLNDRAVHADVHSRNTDLASAYYAQRGMSSTDGEDRTASFPPSRVPQSVGEIMTHSQCRDGQSEFWFFDERKTTVTRLKGRDRSQEEERSPEGQVSAAGAEPLRKRRDHLLPRLMVMKTCGSVWVLKTSPRGAGQRPTPTGRSWGQKGQWRHRRDDAGTKGRWPGRKASDLD